MSTMTFQILAQDGQGDTIVVQTIDFNTPVNPGWNAPREGKYLFPPDTLSFEKILMYYTLKCDPSQSPACGEWDYTTHTNLFHHTGLYDSNLNHHPNFIVNGTTPDTFMVMDNVSWKYLVWFEYSNSTNPSISASIGGASSSIDLSDPSEFTESRLQFLFTAAELSGAGLSSGDITGLQLDIDQAGSPFKKLTIRLKNTDLTTVQPDEYENEGLTLVFRKNISLAPGLNEFDFAFPFTWDGTSNIILDLSYEDVQGNDPTTLYAAPEAGTSISSYKADNNLLFEGGDFIEVPVNAISTLDSAVTISFWQYGSLNQPKNDVLFRANNSEGDRVLNVHLPWSNGRVYWDAGQDGGFDRIDKAADPQDYRSAWNHWAFVKNVHTGIMMIYLNGYPWHIGGAKVKDLTGIVSFSIGGTTGGSYYSGRIDEFRVWNKALDQTTIEDWMFKEVDPSHPDYSSLLAYFQFDEGSGYSTLDASPNSVTAKLYGYPEWRDYRGIERLKNFQQLNDRPQVVFESGTYNPGTLDSTLMIDTIAKGELMIVLYENPGNPTQATDTIDKWPHYYDNYTFDPSGNATDSTLVPPDSILYRIDMPYYIPYEILKSYELGRFITPFGNNLSLGDGWTWVYDVTDFRQFLHDTVHLKAGNFQELLDLKFYMIEGTPSRDVVNIERLWHGYYPLNNFDATVPEDTIQLDPAASMHKIKITTSGHEWDNATNCAEFCQKNHSVDVDGTTRFSWEILDECADNPLYPQGGTWIYDRAGWCPGAKVTLRELELTPYIDSDSVILDYNVDYDQYGKYSVTSYLVSYGQPNFTLDAAVVDILKPNRMEIQGRFNPMCGRPEIIIQNNGSDTLYSLDIAFWPEGGNLSYFQWEGELAYLEQELVTLDPIDWNGWVNGNNTFHVEIENPNGGLDQYSNNNTFKTAFDLTREFPNQFVIHFKTNLAGHQNYYEITDVDGNILFEKDGFSNSTLYKDTLALSDGCYNFTLFDSGDNGIDFWANNQGTGYLYFMDMDNSAIYYIEPDFGKFISLNFTVGLAVNTEENEIPGHFDIFPNPASDHCNVAIYLTEKQDVNIRIYDLNGKIIHERSIQDVRSCVEKFNLGEYGNGMYLCHIQTRNGVIVRKIIMAR